MPGEVFPGSTLYQDVVAWSMQEFQAPPAVRGSHGFSWAVNGKGRGEH